MLAPRISLVLNVLVLVPVVGGLAGSASWAEEAYGPSTPARAILLAVYAAILLVSCVLLVRPEPRATAALLSVQVVYKLLTVATVRTVLHPVVLSNLAIAGVHLVTLWRLSRRQATG